MKLPETKKEWETIKKMFLKKFRVEDSPETWTFILSQLQNTKMPELEFKPEFVFAHYKRWKLTKILQDEKTVYIQALQTKLEEKIKAFNDKEAENERTSQSEHTEHLLNGAFHSEGDVPPLPANEEALVQSTEERRF